MYVSPLPVSYIFLVSCYYLYGKSHSHSCGECRLNDLFYGPSLPNPYNSCTGISDRLFRDPTSQASLFLHDLLLVSDSALARCQLETWI